MKDPPYTNWSYSKLPARAKTRVDATVAAVLRQAVAALREGDLDTFPDDYAKGWQAAWGQASNDLEAWADSIERGE
jgi:hypothetical protein